MSAVRRSVGRFKKAKDKHRARQLARSMVHQVANPFAQAGARPMPKVGRDAFLYLNPSKVDADEFAQCASCRDWISPSDRCYIHAPDVVVPGTASCGLYVNGYPIETSGVVPLGIVTPEESGLVDREVRCENCKWGGPGEYECDLYHQLNRYLPDIFELDTAIEPKGCCNANEPRETEAD